MKKKNAFITGLVLIFTVVALVAFNRITSKKEGNNIFVEVAKGDFEITISASGELVAENTVEIKAPEIPRRGRGIRIQGLKIQDLVPEGTVVSEGDYIATLDRTQYSNSLKDELESLSTYRTNLETKKLDTAVTLTALRDAILNQKSVVEEAQITLLNSKYEPATTIRQAEINLDKQTRLLEQKERGYKLKVAKSKRDVANQTLWYNRVKSRVDDLQEFLAGFSIKAPSAGMVVYKKDHHGEKIKAGSSVNPFERVVATLPDLSSLLSKMYVSEIEVSRVIPGQDAYITIDAFPDKLIKGKVMSVANIGEKYENSDTKVFEVMIKIDRPGPDLRPAMTTGNKIVLQTIKNAVSIPSECLYADANGDSYVYTKKKKKQIVVPGASNEKNIVIEQGLKPGEIIYLVQPENYEKFRVRNLTSNVNQSLTISEQESKDSKGL